MDPDWLVMGGTFLFSTMNMYITHVCCRWMNSSECPVPTEALLLSRYVATIVGKNLSWRKVDLHTCRGGRCFLPEFLCADPADSIKLSFQPNDWKTNSNASQNAFIQSFKACTSVNMVRVSVCRTQRGSSSVRTTQPCPCSSLQWPLQALWL